MLNMTLDEIRCIAVRDPRLAFWILKCSQPGIWNIKATFPGGLTGATLTRTITSTTFGCDVFVRDFEYTVRRPVYALGNLFKPENDTNTTFSPFVDVRIEIIGCPEWEYTDGDTPLEIAATAAVKAHDRALNLYLPYSTSVKVTFTLKRDLLPLENPFEIDFAIKGLYLGCKGFDSCSPAMCLGELRTFGIVPPAFGLPVT